MATLKQLIQSIHELLEKHACKTLHLLPKSAHCLPYSGQQKIPIAPEELSSEDIRRIFKDFKHKYLNHSKSSTSAQNTPSTAMWQEVQEKGLKWTFLAPPLAHEEQLIIQVIPSMDLTWKDLEDQQKIDHKLTQRIQESLKESENILIATPYTEMALPLIGTMLHDIDDQGLTVFMTRHQNMPSSLKTIFIQVEALYQLDNTEKNGLLNFLKHMQWRFFEGIQTPQDLTWLMAHQNFSKGNIAILSSSDLSTAQENLETLAKNFNLFSNLNIQLNLWIDEEGKISCPEWMDDSLSRDSFDTNNYPPFEDSDIQILGSSKKQKSEQLQTPLLHSPKNKTSVARTDFTSHLPPSQNRYRWQEKSAFKSNRPASGLWRKAERKAEISRPSSSSRILRPASPGSSRVLKRPSSSKNFPRPLGYNTHTKLKSDKTQSSSYDLDGLSSDIIEIDDSAIFDPPKNK